MKLNEIMQTYVEKGFVKRELNPSKTLAIYNYTNECTHCIARWDYYTRMARGLILDMDGKIIARPFPKFFNFNEIPETQLINLPQVSTVEVSEKMDGSLGILYQEDGEYKMATRGSFVSDQAVMGTKIFYEKYPYSISYLKSKLSNYNDFTFLFEIIYPEDKKVIDYKGMRDIILVGVVHKEGGWDYSYSETRTIGMRLGFNVIDSAYMSFDGIYQEVQRGRENWEGYVLRYSNGLRVKMKTEQYIQLHRLLYQTTEKTVWELLKNKEDKERYLKQLPEEFKEWFNTTCRGLEEDYKKVKSEIIAIFKNTPKFTDRKEYAEYFKRVATSQQLAILFRMLDNKFYDDLIWKQIRSQKEVTYYDRF